MNADQHKALRSPFPPSAVGKLPRVTCGGCRNAQGKVCERHTKSKCGDCDNYITTAHMHLDYVGHADLTDRLLEVDPEWTWEPVAFGADGLPMFDKNGGMWIRLTVAGVTRLGYGHADGKSGGDAVKEVIGDSLRNSAMRFGVALDLWKKEPAHPEEDRPAARQSAQVPAASVDATDDKRPGPSPADEARTQLRNVCTAMELDPPTVAKVYQETHSTSLREETNAALITAFVIDIRTGKIPRERVRALVS